ncbi:hypothetical protein DDB_G0276039 [Dictyostelium discoideum AX4]|uniref:Small ribosomal subunit protein mS41 n=1 Tax=Dictyostelium discoideum TaxID=44689 RepID=Q75JN4_DICDI|nr:hypothetical protein DDB_G0276039 [Dictyostelium discoideum AX4]EAL69319.1 hypothetical protein DDB_G0276039 [Dictyostelium discoideum AX4]|eukprot:XP_643347.1 hypothetical protein DDB_G0276039 [Dictyostelium discoideum AX4]
MISRLILSNRIISKNTIISSNVAVSSLFNNSNNIYKNNRSFSSKDLSQNTLSDTEATITETIDDDEFAELLGLNKKSKKNKEFDPEKFEQENSYFEEDFEEDFDENFEENEGADEKFRTFLKRRKRERHLQEEKEFLAPKTVLSTKRSESQRPTWGVTYDASEDFDPSDQFHFTPLPTDQPILPAFRAPKTVENLIIKYEDPFKDPSKTNANYFPFFRFTEPRGYTVESFLKQIGRGCDQHVELFEKWEDLMETSSRKLKDLQVPVSNRKWILHWVEEFKQGRDPVLISKSKSRSKSNKKK